MASSIVQLDHSRFIHEFLSPPHINFRPKRASIGPFAQLKCANDLPENGISERFITAVRTHHLTPGSTLTTTPFDPVSMEREAEHSTPTAIYRSTDVPKRGLPHWADQKVSFLFNRYVAGADPFDEDDLDEDYTGAGRERKKLRDRVTGTAELLFAAQQRVFLFMVLIIGTRFRLLRWDRAGVIVTPSVDYIEQPALLCDCLRRLALLDDISLGFDPTAVRLRPCDADFLRMDAAALDDPSDVDHTERQIDEGEIGDFFVFRYVRSAFRDSLCANWPRYRLRIRDHDDTREYLVGKPLHLPSDIVGRGTRGYVAFDCETQRFVWLKDVWRACDLAAEKEGDILGKLNLAGVVNVPTLVCHGDVQDQTTITSRWWDITHGVCPDSFSRECTSPGGTRKRKRDETIREEAPSDTTRQSPPATAREPCPLRRHTHYRIAVEEVAMSLAEFRCGKQLASIVLDCLHAHHQSATNHKIRMLHRDISSGNVLIYPKVRSDEDGKGLCMVWTGLLTDWELAKHIDTEGSLQANRIGTHQFMSVNLLSDPFQAVKVPDELESFFHVLVYYSVRYLRSNCPSPNAWINTYFQADGVPNMYVGGMKTVAIQREGMLSTVVPPGPLLFNSPMDTLLGDLIKSFFAHYKVTEHEFRQALSPLPSSSSAASSSGSGNAAPQGSAAKRTKYYVPTPRYSDDSDYSEDTTEWKPYKPPDTTPTPDELELARRVADHDFTLEFIAGLLRDEGWSDDDRISIPPVPTSKPHPGPGPKPTPADTDTDAAPVPKRRHKAAPKQQVADAPAQPGRRPATARRTRSQAHAASSKTRPARRS
ncbi:hypothetical protein GSI_05171 [Ganoderma sinense ZZ0214-1]|uniref:Fungal-type protein kinase domain-containing protein n=1 Tax=Ganoderma sinense ZZ0214-1 TaxID=1077348 RepID=A0A2G8SFC9_9APHY|nr:hypothetical protein GSI_05171 [Ganoderma sinense ZZ0214-1]